MNEELALLAKQIVSSLKKLRDSFPVKDEHYKVLIVDNDLNSDHLEIVHATYLKIQEVVERLFQEGIIYQSSLNYKDKGLWLDCYLNPQKLEEKYQALEIKDIRPLIVFSKKDLSLYFDDAPENKYSFQKRKTQTVRVQMTKKLFRLKKIRLETLIFLYETKPVNSYVRRDLRDLNKLFKESTNAVEDLFIFEGEGSDAIASLNQNAYRFEKRD